MESKSDNAGIRSKPYTNGEIMIQDANNADMAKEDRRRVVLQFLAEHRLALPPRSIFRNLRLHHNITFGYSTLDNYLDEFADEGLVRRVDPGSLENRELTDLPRGKQNRAYYIITEAGLDYLSE
jgi:Fe2+ or Zn2+ uptake regulation protein